MIVRFRGRKIVLSDAIPLFEPFASSRNICVINALAPPRLLAGFWQNA